MNVTLFGATGYVGSAILHQLLLRGHRVTGISRNAEKMAPAIGLTAKPGSIADADLVSEVTKGADVIVIALPAVGIEDKTLAEQLGPVIKAAGREGARIAVVGAVGSLREVENGPRYADLPEFPDFLLPLARAHDELLDALEKTSPELNWFYLSPPIMFGAFAPGEPRGTYRLGTNLIIKDEAGNSAISGADFGLAFVDEIEVSKHNRQQFTVAY